VEEFTVLWCMRLDYGKKEEMDIVRQARDEWCGGGTGEW